MKTIPYWTDDYPRPADLPVAPLPEQVDVAVVGGGYTGLSAARALAQLGTRVAVLERGPIGAGASSVNGGQVSAGLKKGPRELFHRYGPRLGRELWDASVAALDLVENIIRQEGIECHFARSGSLALAYRPAHYDDLAREAEWMARELNFEHRVIPRGELRQHVGSDAYYGGALEPAGGGLHPARYVYGLARAAARVGAQLCEQAEVRAIHRRAGGGLDLDTTQGRLRASEVLLATNGYTGSLVPEVRRGVFPIGSYIITTEPLPPDVQAEISPRNHVFYDTKWFLNYFRLTPDGRLAMGGRNRLTTDLDLVESARILRQTMVRVFPQLRDVAVTHSWTGRLGITFDMLPHIGRVDGVYYALGYNGHGVSIATYLGKEAAEWIAGRRQRSPFADIPHPKYFFYRRDPWFLPLAGAYFRLRDRIS